MFHDSKKEALFVLFLGVNQHWSLFAVHKIPGSTKKETDELMELKRKAVTQKSIAKIAEINPSKNDCQFYFLDSTNFNHLNEPDENVVNIVN